MINISKSTCFLIIVLTVSLLGCKKPVTEYKETIKEEVVLDNKNEALFDCYINNRKWGKSDHLSASFSVESDFLFLNVNCENTSMIYEKISLLIPLGKNVININQQLVEAVNDTFLALIIYSFSEIDYSTETPIPVNHMAFEFKPTALVSITKVDTVMNSVDGTFKAIAEDENKKKYGFRNGLFQNVIYKKLAL